MLKSISTKLTTGARRLAVTRAVRRLVRRQDGAAMVEFGLVATPFLALLFAILETALIFFAGQALETAVAEAVEPALRSGPEAAVAVAESVTLCSEATLAAWLTPTPPGVTDTVLAKGWAT